MGKLIFGANVICAFLLVLSFVLPYVPPKSFPTISLLSLAVSPLILLNIIFLLYWLLRRKKKLLVSGLILVIAYFHFNPFLEFGSSGTVEDYNNSLKVLTYNVRLFNAYEKEAKDDVLPQLSLLLEEQAPDVICIQEYYKKTHLNLAAYPYQYIYYKDENANMGHAIVSKYPFSDKGSLDFHKTFNNGLFVDVVKNNDTIRVYNIHLQSLGISPTVTSIQKGDKERLRKRLARTFVKQQEQLELIASHKENTKHPIIITGDFNNTPFSYTYHALQKDMNDAFVERGSGLGTTFKFDGYPMRIDYMLSSKSLDVINFTTIKESFSDHYPLVATFGWPSKE
ncbi:endonuclease/exonuclease/phosphatase family protein [Patiriisocius hiemis]|uniref:Endonuclease/exonuclease/phosphatase family protein n=1 Tax=Patiriisocius hiemis TaxID=3075604 RepID=A0ABU2Y8D3_9FLAO|nr:endonuclease/exonuclease/phosphatase family protein [Constantimarinum sp. W242]MDT0554451.1 endonuclease/exonuclease/phosphatase family protein [Constantimarinum sp. W242]